MYVLTGPCHLGNWLPELNCAISLTALRQYQVKNLLATIHVAIVGCHGNPVYLSVAWIPICLSVTWSPKFSWCGRFPWEAPKEVWKNRKPWKRKCLGRILKVSDKTTKIPFSAVSPCGDLTLDFWVRQFNSRNGLVESKSSYLCTSGSCRLRNNLLSKLCTSWFNYANLGYCLSE
jgi:hypothetical protein